MSKVSEIEKNYKISGLPVDRMIIRAYFTGAAYFAREEYLRCSSAHILSEKSLKTVPRYTFDNFVADIGGYLGLLLGHSALSLFEGTLSSSNYVMRQIRLAKGKFY